MGELGFCTTHDITQQVLSQILSDITTDVGWPLILIRVLHNKLVYGIFFSLKCYIYYFDAIQLTRFVPPMILLLAAYAFIDRSSRRLLFFVQLALPLFFIFDPLGLKLSSKIGLFKTYYTVLGIFGLLKILTNYQKIKLFIAGLRKK